MNRGRFSLQSEDDNGNQRKIWGFQNSGLQLIIKDSPSGWTELGAEPDRIKPFGLEIIGPDRAEDTMIFRPAAGKPPRRRLKISDKTADAAVIMAMLLPP